MIRITQLKLPITHTEEQLHRKIAKTLRLGNQPFTYEIRKQSLDARHKEDKKFVYTVDIKLDNESRILKKVHDKNIMLTAEKEYHFPTPGSETLSHRPVVIGSGPAGLFCAWYLAKAGYCPLVLERGEEADKRQETVENFWKNGILDPNSNVQFGEGGAGTFSDGKLNTLVKDTYGRGKEVLSRFVEAGAPSEILYQQKPHLGTDQLVGIVQFMRYQIENGTVSLGGKTILNHIDFSIKGQEKIAVVGRNGAGKTTLLRLISGELSLDRDDKRFGKGITTDKAISIGFLHQQSFSNAERTVEEEILSLVSEEDIFSKERYYFEKEYDRIFTGFGFKKEDKCKKIGQFSGGEQTKLAFIKLLLSKPDILLLDEPTNHLDMESITALNNGLIKFPGVLLFTSRDHQIVQTTANRIMEIVPGGKLIDKITTYDEYLESDEMARKRQTYTVQEEDN